MEDSPNQVHCPKCGSTQITAYKKGFSTGKAIVGDLLLGPVGLLAGSVGRNDIIITCLSCGNQFKPGEKAKPVQQSITYKTLPRDNVRPSQIKIAKVLGIIFSVISVPLTVLIFALGEIGFGVFLLLPTLIFLFMAFRKSPEK